MNKDFPYEPISGNRGGDLISLKFYRNFLLPVNIFFRRAIVSGKMDY
jgi:hypothetical protein